MQQDNAAELSRLIQAFQALDPAQEPQRARDLLQQAAALVDRTLAPLKWAALRSLFGDLAEQHDPTAAVAAYQDALSVWDPADQHDPWVHCHMQLGCLLSSAPPGSDDAEAAIIHLEHAVDDNPYLARLLATLYGFRPGGDPADNWRRRVLFLERALAQLDPEQDVVAWAAVSNDLACAYPEEPAGDYAAALEKRMALHHKVLLALQSKAGPVVPTLMHLATAYLDRAQGEPSHNGQAAQSCIQQALDALPDDADPALKIELLLLRARALLFKPEHAQQAEQQPRLDKALAVLEQARALAADRPQPELRGSVAKLFALTYLEQLRLGQSQQLDRFVASCSEAMALFAAPAFASERRKLMQIQADGLLTVGDFAGAGRCCASAVLLAEADLAQASSTAGRLERIWALRDSASLQAYCLAQSGQLAAAVDALDRGKARLWRPEAGAPASTQAAAALPAGGALLMPIFAGDTGLVVLATAGSAGVRFTRVELPGLGRQRRLELQRGADPKALGGWLQAYCYRRSEPARFQAQIMDLGEVLHREFWAPVLAGLSALGVMPGAELVMLPDGASAGFPWLASHTRQADGLHWLGERYALRILPSLAAHAPETARAAADGPAPPMAVVAADPGGDLAFAALEVAWIQAVHANAQVLCGAGAVRDQVLQLLQTCTDVHITSHAEFNLDSPFESRLRLHDGDLTLAQWVGQRPTRQPHFVALSACETGVTRVTSLADEFLGFPAALLHGGVHTVLATQWSVDDAASALLMGQFYRERAGQGLARPAPVAEGGGDPSAHDRTAAQCLRRAQRWLRTLTVAELMALLREWRDLPGPAGGLAASMRSRLRAQDSLHCPYAHPYHWAGFFVAGGR